MVSHDFVIQDDALWLCRSRAKGSEPTIVLQCLEMAILMKPAGWEVFGHKSERPITTVGTTRLSLGKSYAV